MTITTVSFGITVLTVLFMKNLLILLRSNVNQRIRCKKNLTPINRTLIHHLNCCLVTMLLLKGGWGIGCLKLVDRQFQTSCCYKVITNDVYEHFKCTDESSTCTEVKL